MSSNHLTPRQFLAKEIKLAREAKGMKVEELAAALFVSSSLVRAWEKGRRIPVPEDMDKIEEFFGFNGVLRRLRDELVNAAAPLEWFGKWPLVERNSSSIWWLELAIIPGLFQTEEYARTLLEAAHLVADTEEMVQARMLRQEILEAEDPPLIVALLSESALLNNVGGPDIMYAQLTRLVDLGARSNIIIQVIRSESPACAGFTGPFILAEFEFADPSDGSDGMDGIESIAYTDNAIKGEVIDDRENVIRLRRMFDILRSRALSHDESLEIIRRKAEQWKT